MCKINKYNYKLRVIRILSIFKKKTSINISNKIILFKRFCLLTNRKKAIYKNFKVSRIILRDLSPNISGLRKLS